MKKMKNEKIEKTRKKNEEMWFHTQSPRRFPGFTVVVVTFFVKILYDFHDYVLESVSFSRKINNPVLRGRRFSEEKLQFSLVVKQNTHFPTKNNETIAEISSFINNCSFPFNNHTQQHTTTHTHTHTHNNNTQPHHNHTQPHTTTHNQQHNKKTTQQHNNTQRCLSHACPLFHVRHSCCEMDLSWQPVTGAAQRRKGRRAARCFEA